MKVGYMTGVLMGEVAPNTDVKNTFVEETEGSQVNLKDGVQESNGSNDNNESNDDSSSDSGSYTFLNTKMIVYVILGLALFKAFKK